MNQVLCNDTSFRVPSSVELIYELYSNGNACTFLVHLTLRRGVKQIHLNGRIQVTSLSFSANTKNNPPVFERFLDANTSSIPPC